MSTLVRQKYNGPVDGALRRVVKRAGKFISNKPSHTQNVLRNKLYARRDYFVELKKHDSENLYHLELYDSMAQVRARTNLSTWNAMKATIVKVKNNHLYNRKGEIKPLTEKFRPLYVRAAATAVIAIFSGSGAFITGGSSITNVMANKEVLECLVAGAMFLGYYSLRVLIDSDYRNFRSHQEFLNALDHQQPFAQVENPRIFLPTVQESLSDELTTMHARFDAKWQQLQGYKASVVAERVRVEGKEAKTSGNAEEKMRVLGRLDRIIIEMDEAIGDFEANCLMPLKDLESSMLQSKMAELEARVQNFEAALTENALQKKRAEVQANLTKAGVSGGITSAQKPASKPVFWVNDILLDFEEELDAFLHAHKNYLKDSYGKPAGNGRLFQNGEVSVASDTIGTVSLANKRHGQISVRP